MVRVGCGSPAIPTRVSERPNSIKMQFVFEPFDAFRIRFKGGCILDCPIQFLANANIPQSHSTD
jgi:hypothetical protein